MACTHIVGMQYIPSLMFDCVGDRKKGACIIGKDDSGRLADRLVKSVYFFPIMLKSTGWDSLARPSSNKQLPIALIR